MTLADFAHLSAVLASLLGLSAWARATSTRAWGEPADAPRSLFHRTVALATLLLQGCTALATGQWVDAIALVAAAWMVLGGAVRASSLVSISAKAYSFQAKIRQKTAVAAMPVIAWGSTILKMA